MLAQGMEMPFRGVMVIGILDRASLPLGAAEMPNENFIINYTGLTLDERIVLLKKATIFLDDELRAAICIFRKEDLSDGPSHDRN